MTTPNQSAQKIAHTPETVSERIVQNFFSGIPGGNLEQLANAAPALLEACKKTKAFIDDLSQSNPGYLGTLVLQDYAQFNEVMIALPAAISLAEKPQ